MVDQLPADAVIVEVADHLGRRAGGRHAVRTPGDAVHRRGPGAVAQRLQQERGGALALAAHDVVDLRIVAQDVFPVIGRVDAAVHDRQAGPGRLQGRGQAHDGVVGRGGTGMPHQHQVGRGVQPRAHDGVVKHGAEFGVEQAHREAGVDQRPANAQQAERRQLFTRDAASDGGMGRIDQQDVHRP